MVISSNKMPLIVAFDTQISAIKGNSKQDPLTRIHTLIYDSHVSDASCPTGMSASPNATHGATHFHLNTFKMNTASSATAIRITQSHFTQIKSK